MNTLLNSTPLFWQCTIQKKVCDGIVHCNLQVAACTLMLVIAMSLHRVQLEDYFKTNNRTKKEN